MAISPDELDEAGVLFLEALDRDLVVLLHLAQLAVELGDAALDARDATVQLVRDGPITVLHLFLHLGPQGREPGGLLMALARMPAIGK